MSGITTPDQRADARASRQHGAINRSQAYLEGMTRNHIADRVASGRWIRATRSVYVTAGSPDTWLRRLSVAILSGPAETFASHLSAAALFELTDPPDRHHVTVPREASGRKGEAVIHRGRLTAADVSERLWLPCTSPARTLVDCAALVDRQALCRLLDTALYRKLVSTGEIRRAAARASRAPGRGGLARLQEALAPWTDGVHPGSPAEARTLRCLKRWGLPDPERQFKIRDEAGRLVARGDFAWPPPKVLLEYDGEEHHGPRAWVLDEEREARVVALGWTVVRADKEDLRPSATRLPRLLGALLGVVPAA